MIIGNREFFLIIKKVDFNFEINRLKNTYFNIFRWILTKKKNTIFSSKMVFLTVFINELF